MDDRMAQADVGFCQKSGDTTSRSSVSNSVSGASIASSGASPPPSEPSTVVVRCPVE